MIISSTRSRFHVRPARPLGGRAGHALVVLAALALIVGVAGCRTFQVRSDWDEARSFDGTERIHFVEPAEAEPGMADPFADNDLLRKRVRRAIEAELTRRGYRVEKDRAQADLLVTYQVLLEDKYQASGVSVSPGLGYYRRGLGASVQTTTNVRNFQEATLMIDLLDPAEEDLVWRGWGEGMLSTRDRSRRTERLDEGVRAILARFPPKQRTPSR